VGAFDLCATLRSYRRGVGSLGLAAAGSGTFEVGRGDLLDLCVHRNDLLFEILTTTETAQRQAASCKHEIEPDSITHYTPVFHIMFGCIGSSCMTDSISTKVAKRREANDEVFAEETDHGRDCWQLRHYSSNPLERKQASRTLDSQNSHVAPRAMRRARPVRAGEAARPIQTRSVVGCSAYIAQEGTRDNSLGWRTSVLST
jgi:hypothetical protein